MHWTADQRQIGRYYLAYQKLMGHWNNLFPGDIHEASYEALVAEPEKESRKLLAFCGLDWHDDCLKFHEAKRTVTTASSLQVRRPIYGDSVRKWRKYEKYLQPLIETLDAEKT